MAETATITATKSYQCRNDSQTPAEVTTLDIGAYGGGSSRLYYASYAFDLSAYADKRITAATLSFYTEYAYNTSVTLTAGIGVTDQNTYANIVSATTVNYAATRAIKTAGQQTGIDLASALSVMQRKSTVYVCLGDIEQDTSVQSRKQIATQANQYAGNRPKLTITYEDAATINYGENGEWEPCECFYPVNGSWVRCKPHLGQNGQWKELTT